MTLGSVPSGVRAVVQRLIAEERRKRPSDDPRLALALCAGPGGAAYLDAEGEVWCDHWAMTDEEHDLIERVPDGPRKVYLVAIGAERIPELAEWLPRRPAQAKDCQTCHATGWLQPPLPRIGCPHCHGLGWRV